MKLKNWMEASKSVAAINFVSCSESARWARFQCLCSTTRATIKFTFVFVRFWRWDSRTFFFFFRKKELHTPTFSYPDSYYMITGHFEAVKKPFEQKSYITSKCPSKKLTHRTRLICGVSDAWVGGTNNMSRSFAIILNTFNAYNYYDEENVEASSLIFLFTLFSVVIDNLHTENNNNL